METTTFTLNKDFVLGGKELNCEYLVTQDKYNQDVAKVSWVIDGEYYKNEYKNSDIDRYFDSGIWVKLIK